MISINPEIMSLSLGDKIVLLPDPEEGFMDEEHVRFVHLDRRNGILAVENSEHGVFEVGVEQYARKDVHNGNG